MKRKGISKSLKSEYRELAQIANQLHKDFMKEFDKISPAERNILRGNLPSAMKGKRTAAKLKVRGATEIDYKVAIKELKRFLESESSTIEGYKTIVDRRVKAIKDSFDTAGLTDNDIKQMMEFLGTAQGEQSKEIYDSNLVVQALIIGRIDPKNKKKSFADIYKDVENTGYTIADYIRKQEESKEEWVYL